MEPPDGDREESDLCCRLVIVGRSTSPRAPSHQPAGLGSSFGSNGACSLRSIWMTREQVPRMLLPLRGRRVVFFDFDGFGMEAAPR